MSARFILSFSMSTNDAFRESTTQHRKFSVSSTWENHRRKAFSTSLGDRATDGTTNDIPWKQCIKFWAFNTMTGTLRLEIATIAARMVWRVVSQFAGRQRPEWATRMSRCLSILPPPLNQKCSTQGRSLTSPKRNPQGRNLYCHLAGIERSK